jgi:Flp pilus assembly pilin Flp
MSQLIDALTSYAAREQGQSMAEYAVVLAVIVIAILVALGALAGGISGTLGSVTSSL